MTGFVSGILAVLFLAICDTADGWTDPNYTNTIVFYEFGASGNPTDDSGYVGSNDGTLGSGSRQPTWVAATNGISAHYFFDGADVISRSSTASLAQTRTNATWSAWVYSTADRAVDVVYTAYGASGSSFRGHIWQDSQPVFTARVANVTQTLGLKSNGRVPTNSWHFLALSFSGATPAVDLYVDHRRDRHVTSGVPGTFKADSSLFVGANMLIAFLGWDGRLDRFAMYKVAISTSQNLDLFWNTATNYGWSAYDYANRTQWSNTLYVGTFTYDWPADTSFVSTNAGSKGSGGAAPTFACDGRNGWYSFDGGDTIALTVPGTKAAYAWWGMTNGIWRHYALRGSTQYVDAVQAGFPNRFCYTSGNTVTLGRNASAQYLTGRMDDFRVYKAFTTTELSNLYEGTRATYQERGSRVEF